jgi:LemA protein
MILTLVIAAAVLVVGIRIYNTLVKGRNRVLAAWSDIDVQLKKRHDLVPQLVTAVKAYAAYENATLTAVTELRTRSEAETRLPQKAELEQQIEQAVHNLIVVAEAYPELKADQNFRQLQTGLIEVEDHLQYARRYYNGAVRIFNTGIQSFPQLLLAGPLGFKPAEFFAVADAAEREVPRVELQ